MPLVAVKYEGDIKNTVDAYNALDKDTQSGDYWDNENFKEVKKYIKEHYLKVQDYTCVYCQQKIVVTHGMAWDIEHIIPKSSYANFLFTEKNLAIACKDCNLRKKDKNVLVNPKRKTFPNKSGDYIIVHPHFDEYDEHIKVIRDSQLYIAKDEKGVNTIQICELLRFTYAYSNYGTNSVEITNRMVELNKAFIDASSPMETMAINGLIRDLLNHSDKMARESYLKSL